MTHNPSELAKEEAFARPTCVLINGNVDYGAPGMTKREYFAAAALQGLCAQPALATELHAKKEKAAELTGFQAVLIADAVIAALTKAPPVLALAALMLLAPIVRAADEPITISPSAPGRPSLRTITAQSDLVGALACRRLGYGYFVRLTANAVACLASNAGANNAIEIKAFLERRL